jgi:hypothetical protein
MNKEEAMNDVYKMLNVNGEILTEDFTKETIQETLPEINLEFLPELKDEEYLLYFDNYIVCYIQPIAKDILTIQYNSYRKNEKNQSYVSGEYEKREILKLLIKWVADITNKEIKFNNNNILTIIEHDFIDMVWRYLYPKINIQSSEASLLYQSARKYFLNDMSVGTPIDPVIVEVDLLCKFGNMSLKEIQSIKKIQLDKYKIVLMARTEVMSMTNSMSPNHTQRNQAFNFMNPGGI